jgi:hypothetical protein
MKADRGIRLKNRNQCQLSLARSNEPCTDRSSNARRELARKLPYPIDKEIEIEYDT